METKVGKSWIRKNCLSSKIPYFPGQLLRVPGINFKERKGALAMDNTLCDVSKEKEGDGACRLDNTNDSSYPELCQKSIHYVLDF